MEAIERSMGCLKAGWGWESAYDRLSRAEFLVRAESLIARHETRAANGERCLQQLAPLMAEVTALSEVLATQRTGSFDRTHDLAVLMHAFIAARGGFVALEAIRDTVTTATASELEEYLNSE